MDQEGQLHLVDPLVLVDLLDLEDPALKVQGGRLDLRDLLDLEDQWVQPLHWDLLDQRGPEGQRCRCRWT